MTKVYKITKVYKMTKACKILLAPMGVLAPASTHAGPSAQPPSALAESISPNFPFFLSK